MRSPALALLLTACGGAGPAEHPAGDDTTAGAEAAPEATTATADCPADEAPLDGDCFSVEGTRWWFVTDLPVGGHREFEIVLHPGGRLEVGDEADSTPNDDEWVQEGRIVTISMNDRYVRYSATIENARELRGRGVNVRDEKWDFVATRR